MSASHQMVARLLPVLVTLSATAFAADAVPHTPQAALAQEAVPAGEEEATARIREMIARGVEDEFHHSADGIARRDAHAKHHGCVKATFEVNADLPARYRVGVFSEPGKAYPAWIRYSNGSGHPSKDSKADGRGMAVKLMGVEGDKVLDEELHEQTQDFLMIDSPAFFVRNAQDYVQLVDSVTRTGAPFRFFFPSVLPWKWHLHEMVNGARLQFKHVEDPLVLRYWSMTPYLFGQGRAVKYSAQPCEGPSEHSPFAFPAKDANRLREAMVKRLSSQGACYDFMVQEQTFAGSMPIEDAAVEWSEARSRFVKVARIEIPAQVFDTPEQQDFCENLSFTPWHALPEHRPLGGINRVRKTVYQTISKLRHQLNGRERKEPTPESGISLN